MKKKLTILTMVAWAGVASAGTLFVEDFNDNSFGGNLQQMDTDGTGLVVENGSVRGEGNYRRYVATVDSDYNLSDWAFEIDINAQDTGNGPGIALIGFGSAIRNPGVYDVPSSDDSYLQLGEGGGGGGINFYSPVIGGTEYNWGTFGGNGLKRVRISKSGNDLTFEVDTDYAGGAFTADWNRTINIGSAGYSSSNSRLFFGTYSDRTYFDNFYLSDSPRPDAALNPNPINSSDVFVDPNVASLSWATPDTHYTYDIYLSPDKGLVERGDASVLLAGDHTATSVNVSLSNAQRYYWRVDTINGGTKTGGKTWTFVAGDPNDTGSSAYYVATNGSDLNAGTEASPFATVQRAASRLGCDLMAGATSDKTVYIRGGTYYLSSALTFTEWESPDAVNQTVTYKNYPGEKPVLVGGELLTDWTLDTGRIYKTYVGAGREFYSLFENGDRSTMARTPNSGYFETETRGDSFTVFGFKSGDLPAFDYSDAQVYCWPGEPFWNWFSMTQPIVNIDWETRSITLENGDPTFYNLKTGNRYFVQGAKEFLDSPGEFYLDQSTGWLYYWPVLSPVADQNIVAATTKTLVQFKGTDSSTPVRNIILEGLELNGSDFDKAFVEDAQRLENVNEYGLVVMENAVSNTVRNCRLANAGYDGILLEKYAQDNTIEGNFIENIGRHGVNLSGWLLGAGGFAENASSYVNKSNTISNNFIRDVGRLVGHGCGITVYQSGDNEIAHNEISKSTRMGVYMTGFPFWNMAASYYGESVTYENHKDFVHARNNQIAYNDISDYGTDSQDLGGIYTWSVGTYNVINNNRVHDARSFGNCDGIYLDDATSYTTVTNNIVHDLGSDHEVSRSLYIKGNYNVATNNILAFHDSSPESGVIPSEVFFWFAATEPQFSTWHVTFERNILYQPNGRKMMNQQQWDEQRFASCDYNLYYHPGGTYEVGPIPGPDTYANWLTLDGGAYDQNSLIADPLFVDVANRNFNLQPDSPAFSLGFVNIDQDSIGLKPSFPLTVVNGDVVSTASLSLTYSGEVISTAGEDVNVYIYWGDNDGGTDPGAWDNVENLGTMGEGQFSKSLSSLADNTTYYFRSYVSNSGGSDWADSTAHYTFGVPANTIESQQSGNWTNTATWGGGSVPGYGDVVYVPGDDVTISTPTGQIGSLASWGGAEVVLEGGADLQTTGRVQVNGSSLMTVKAGAALSVGEYLFVGTSTGQEGSLIVDGGTVNADAVFLGESNGANSVSNLEVRSGLLESPVVLIFGGGAGSVAQASITGGRAIFPGVAFNASNHSNPETLTIDGGELILTGDPSGSFSAGGFGFPATSNVFYESGLIIWEGINTVAEFNAFATTFNGWVDSGNLTSASHTSQELKDGLQFIDGDAVLFVFNTIQSQQSGNWSNPATWGGGGVPGYGDIVYVPGDDVTISTPTVPIGSLASWGGAEVVLEGGADLQTTGRVQVNGSGILTVKAGAALSVGEYLMAGTTTGQEGSLIIDGGTVNADAVFLGESSGANSVSNLEVRSGLLESPVVLIFGGGAGSVAQASITGGRAIFPGVAFNASNHSNPETLTIDGGELILTGDPIGSFSAGGFGFPATSNVFYESGLIIWEGINTVAEFNAFATTFNGWVDSGNLTSSLHTNAELYDGLRFVEGTGAVLAVPTDFEIWLSDNSLGGVTFEEDSNQDGLPNGLQWALGLAANESPAPHLLTFATSTPTASTYTIGLPAGGSAGAITVSFTPDLTTAFTPLASGAVSVGNPIPAGTTGMVTITLPAGDQGFLKMSAVAP